MKYRLFGRTGLRVSEICLGSMIFGDKRGTWGTDVDDACAIIARFGEAGGNFIDTANYYAKGESERTIGKALGSDRGRWVIGTKYALSTDRADPNAGGGHRKNLVQSLEASLKRLGTDYVDIYWLHIWDAFTPVDEVLRAFDDVVRAGKVRYVGVSDTPAWQVAHAIAIAELRGWSRFAGLQIPYSLMQRTVERDLLPMARALDVAVTTWEPLGGGVLTGSYGTGRHLPESARAAQFGKKLSARELSVADALNSVADERGVSAAQVALAWLLSRQDRAEIIPIVGARTVGQIESALTSLDLHLSSSEIETLDQASAIELGFPYDFKAGQLLYGDTRDLLQDHRGLVAPTL